MSDNPFPTGQKKFSVIAPVYKDCWKTFPKFFATLNEQQYREFEVIISFDGENKEGKRELAKMRKKYPEMSILDTTNEWGGAPKARNHGADIATGDYLTFLDPDVYLYSDTLRFWADKLEENPDKDVVWGLYDVIVEGEKYPIGGSVPRDNGGEPVYWAFRFSNYCSGAFPVRKEAFVGWDETVKSLQDWDMWVRMLKKDNFEGKKFQFYPRSFFATENVRTDGISADSHNNWKERVKYVKEKNGIPLSNLCVCSMNAPFHGINAAKLLGADYLPLPSYKPHDYKAIYLLGFYMTNLDAHLAVFQNDGQKAKKIVHWIGTDIYQMYHSVSVGTFREMTKLMRDDKWIQLTEVDYTHKEMKDLGIKTKVVPIPPLGLSVDMPKLPEEFTVAIYENPNSKMYSEKMMDAVVRAMPDVKFLFFGDDTKKDMKGENFEHLGWVDIDELIAKSSCNLRVTIHDGLPLTPIQFLGAGRQVVTNVRLKGTIHTDPDLHSVVEAIREARRKVLEAWVPRYWRKTMDTKRFNQAIWRYVR